MSELNAIEFDNLYHPKLNISLSPIAFTDQSISLIEMNIGASASAFQIEATIAGAGL
ncbi:hypothetical protein BX616_005549, partial [Lobosporangium transversale]